MSTVTVSRKRNRVYERKFDHDEARRLRIEEGLDWAELGRRFGVTATAVRRVCDLEFRLRMDERTRQHLMSGVCRCGAQRTLYAPLCVRCSAEEKQTRFRLDDAGKVIEVRCGHCKEWKHPREFGHYKAASRGIRHRCRTCDSAARRDYRERTKEPCVGCGKPALPGREKGARGRDEPRCRDCMVAYMRSPEGREEARQQLAARGGIPRAPRAESKPNLCPKGHLRRRGAKVCDTCIAEYKRQRNGGT